MDNQGIIYTNRFDGDWDNSLLSLLDAAGLDAALQNKKRVLIKPNLVKALPSPVTTPVELIEAIVSYIQLKAPHIEVLVADGTGSLDYDTEHVFDTLGYRSMAERRGIELIDLNEAPYLTLTNPTLKRWPTMHLPEVVMESYLISVPVLKAHSLAGVTLSMKNMMGACPPEHYCKGGHWKKSSFHAGMQEAVADLNRYRKPDFAIIDATIGLAEHHLGGPVCDPPPELLIGGYDPVAADAYASAMLGKAWQSIGHIAAVNGELGQAEPLQVIKV
jgi:uncharacterized protein (DUF362 family)